LGATLEKALDSFKKGYEIDIVQKKHNDQNTKALYLAVIGDVLAQMQNYPGAIQYYTELVNARDITLDKSGINAILQDLYAKIGQQPPASLASTPAPVQPKPAAPPPAQVIDLTGNNYGPMEPISVQMSKAYRLKFFEDTQWLMVVIENPSGALPIMVWTEGTMDTVLELDTIFSSMKKLMGMPVVTEKDVKIEDDISSGNKNGRLSFNAVPNGAQLVFRIQKKSSATGTFILRISDPNMGGYF
jgi:uncharacterized protein YwbE